MDAPKDRERTERRESLPSESAEAEDEDVVLVALWTGLR
jgi:hypothetical protein